MACGNTFGLRAWIEYGFKQAKDELGWADYRLTDAASIERWWELVMCAYLLVSLQAPALALSSAQGSVAAPAAAPAAAPVAAPVAAPAADAGSPPETGPHPGHPAWTEDAS